MHTPSISDRDFTRPKWWASKWSIAVYASIAAGFAVFVAGMPPLPLFGDDEIAANIEEERPIASIAPTQVGTPPPLPEVPIGTDSSVSDKPLTLILTGTMPGRNSREGTAFIGVSRESPQTYIVGAILANGARLTEIYRDRVVLTRGNQSVELHLDGSGKKTPPAALASLLQVGGPQPELPKITPSSDGITDYIRPSPVYDGDFIKGYQVYPGARSGVFAQLGLKPGDVITSINDAPFASPDQAIDLFAQITTGIAVVATVEREGKQERVTLDGSVIVADQEQQRNAAVATPISPLGPPPI